MKVLNNISCDAAQELISPFIDSMVSSKEAHLLQEHLSECHDCRHELQSLASLRTLMAGVEPSPVPEDLQLETRVRLSHERSRSLRAWWQSRMDEDYGDGFKLASYSTPCCGARCTLHELVYEWPQGFGRFALDAMNPNIGALEDRYKAEFEEILGTKLRVIYQHI